MGKFKTLDLAVVAAKDGNYKAKLDLDLPVIQAHLTMDVTGRWRSRPKGRRLFTHEEIRAIRGSRLSQRDLAKIFDCSHVSIYHIVNRSIYRDVI